MTSNQPWWLTWPPAEVAATILPLFSSFDCLATASVINAIVGWCKAGEFGNPRLIAAHPLQSFRDPDSGAVGEAIQVLEHAGLLREATGEFVGLTRLGRHALQTNTVRQHLGLGDTPPQP
jgi:hypothetical protein